MFLTCKLWQHQHTTASDMFINIIVDLTTDVLPDAPAVSVRGR